MSGRAFDKFGRSVDRFDKPDFGSLARSASELAKLSASSNRFVFVAPLNATGFWYQWKEFVAAGITAAGTSGVTRWWGAMLGMRVLKFCCLDDWPFDFRPILYFFVYLFWLFCQRER